MNSTAGAYAAIYSGAYVSAGGVFNGAYTAGAVAFAAASADAEFSAQIQTLQNTGVSGLTQSLIAGGVGNDSIFLGDQLSTFSNVSIKGGKGNDILGTFNSGANTAGHLGVMTGGLIKGGDGDDTVFFNTEGASATQVKVVGNGGNDTVMFSGLSTEVNSGLIGGGAGNDSVTVSINSANKATVNGGDGNDLINVLFSAGTDGSLIKGDGNSTGADTINLGLSVVSSTTVDGGLGADSIVLSGLTDGGSNLYDAGAGNDTVFFQSAGVDTISASTVAGGAGNDSILFQALSAGAIQSALVKGGAGNDTITFYGQGNGTAGAVGASIKGGGGKDSLTLNAVGSAGGSGTFVFTKYNESTLDSMDTLTFNTAAVSSDGDAGYASSKVLVNVAAGLTTGVSGAGAVGQISASGGFVVFSGYSDNSITARVSAINAGYTTTGDFAVFTTDNTTRYLFVQGGTTDLVARLSDEASLSAGLGTLVKSGNTIGLGA
jgi:hypothetical protein